MAPKERTVELSPEENTAILLLCLEDRIGENRLWLKESGDVGERREFYREIAEETGFIEPAEEDLVRIVSMISPLEYGIREDTLMHRFLTENGLTALAAKFESQPDALDELIELFPHKRKDYEDYFGGKKKFIEEKGYEDRFRNPVPLNGLLLMRDLGFFPQEELEAAAKLFIVDFLHSGKGAIVGGDVNEEQMREIDRIAQFVVNDESWGFQPGDLEKIVRAVVNQRKQWARQTRLSPDFLKELLRWVSFLPVDLDEIDTRELEVRVIGPDDPANKAAAQAFSVIEEALEAQSGSISFTVFPHGAPSFTIGPIHYFGSLDVGVAFLIEEGRKVAYRERKLELVYGETGFKDHGEFFRALQAGKISEIHFSANTTPKHGRPSIWEAPETGEIILYVKVTDWKKYS